MNPSERLQRHDDDERPPDSRPPPYPPLKSHPAPGLDAPDRLRTEFTLLVAGCRGGKTSFLRLLLDTSNISPAATQDQLASVAKFVQGCNSHTSAIRSTSIDINVDIDGSGNAQHIGLHLIDTPSLEFSRDEKTADWRVSETLRHIDSRFLDAAEMEWTPQKNDRFVHLCMYFLDPDQIVPPVPATTAPLVSRARTNSFSHTEPEPVILEPPLTTNPLLLRPTLPPVEIETIRRLSSRVNVLPVISRADVLSNDRLAAVKVAIRRDLAEAGIGFGIFDMDHPYQPHPQDDLPSAKNGEVSNGYGGPPNGSASSNNNTPPTSPATPVHLRLPYALISPDIYSHSDGVARITPTRHELVQQYTPSPPHYPAVSKIPRGRYTRSYRWGALDVLDPSHSDFLTLRAAIFHHMETLQKYTRDYLFDKFRVEYMRQQRPSPRHHPLQHHHPQNLPHVGPLSHGPRPILAIDTAPHQPLHRHPPPMSGSRDILGGDLRSSVVSRPMPDAMSSTSGRTSSRSTKQRSKKITVACNFCRSRKLKCDGGRPACSQCVKRSNPCDYMPQNKRRNTLRQRKDDESDSDSGDEGSVEPEEHSVSPKVSSQPLSRRSSNVDKLNRDGFGPLPQINIIERRDEPLPGPSSSRDIPPHRLPEPRNLFQQDGELELPRIATLALPPERSPTTPVPMSAPTLTLIRPASEQQAAQRKRAVTFPGKGARQTTNAGPKVVACNFCRARKTKCDGAHPACASCARRSLPCNYVHDSGNSGGGQKKGRRGSSTKPPADSPHSLSPPSSRMVPTPTTGGGYDPRETDDHLQGEIDLKRNMDYADVHRPPKKMRMENSSAIP